MTRLRLVVERDGPRYRWVLMMDSRRVAKGSRWWDTEQEARDDYDDFEEAMRDAPIVDG